MSSAASMGPLQLSDHIVQKSPNWRANENKENSNVEKLILLYNLGCFIGISTTEKNCLTTHEK